MPLLADCKLRSVAENTTNEGNVTALHRIRKSSSTKHCKQLFFVFVLHRCITFIFLNITSNDITSGPLLYKLKYSNIITHTFANVAADTTKRVYLYHHPHVNADN